jgi:DNA-binding XRE family transcriptional regulator
MNTSKLSNGYLSLLFFELGLALRLNKLTTEDVSRSLSVEKIKKLVDTVESREYTNWNDPSIKPGEILKAALEIHEISQAELAKELKVSPQKINDLVKGRITFTTSWAKKIAGVLGVSYKIFV